MLLGTLIALTVVAMPADASPAYGSTSGDVRFTQDEFGDPPPPPPAIEQGPDVSEPAPPPPAIDEAGPPPRSDDDDEGDEGSDEEDGELGFVERYFPFSLTKDMHPAVEDIIWSFWVANFIPVIPFPQIWLPMVALEGDVPSDYLLDAIIVYALHIAPHLALLVVGLPLLVLGAIPYVGWFLILPCALACNGANLIGLVVNAWYLLPVALANTMDRDLKAEIAAGERDAWLHRRRDDAVAAAMPY